MHFSGEEREERPAKSTILARGDWVPAGDCVDITCVEYIA